MRIFVNQSFCHSQNETSTIICHSIENLLGYKMMPNSRGICIALKNFSLSHLPKIMKKPCILTLCLSEMCLFSMKPAQFFLELVKCIKSCKLRANQRGKSAAFEISSVSQYQKIMKNSYILPFYLYGRCLFPVELKLFCKTRTERRVEV